MASFPATPAKDGVMSAADKTKLDTVATNANDYTHPNHTGDVTSVGDGAQTIANDAVSNAKAANMAANTVKARASGAGDPTDVAIAASRILGRAAAGDLSALTPAQVTALLDAFTSVLKGVVPASGGGSINFLRADGTWAAPPGAASAFSPGHADGAMLKFSSVTTVDCGKAGITTTLRDSTDALNISFSGVLSAIITTAGAGWPTSSNH